MIADGTNTVWLLTRAAGITAYLLLWLSLTLGIGITSRVFEPEVKRLNVWDMHQFVSLFSLLFVGLHVFILLADQYVTFSVAEVLVPFHSHYQPVWVGLGQIAFYLLLITTASFYVRGLIGWKAWRTMHYGTFALYLFALAHGITNGTDTREVWMLIVYCTTALFTAVLLGMRLGQLRQRAQQAGIAARRAA
ncbi:MAG: ferric reductase [Chloroflexi bacterium]|nr:ferric reductase [Chloroflexota bacterium]